MDEAISLGIDAIVEFGGGLGKEGVPPEERRPNLEGMVKKALKLRQHNAEYFGAISVQSIQSLADNIL